MGLCPRMCSLPLLALPVLVASPVPASPGLLALPGLVLAAAVVAAARPNHDKGIVVGLGEDSKKLHQSQKCWFE